MPIKLMIKLCWASNIVMGIILMAVAGFIFITPGDGALIKEELNIDIVDAVDTGKPPESLSNYMDIWQTEVNTKAPKVIQNTATTPPEDWFQKLLSQNIKIETIVAAGYAFVTMNNQNYLLEERNESNKNDVSKNWEVNIAGQNVIVLKITPGKGILFQFQDGKEVWLQHISNTPSENQKPEKSGNIKSRMLGTDHWLVSAADGESLLKNADEHISELAPTVERNENGLPVGIKIRKVLPNSKAYNYGLRANDLVKNVNGMPLQSTDINDIKQMAQKFKNEKRIIIEIVRDGKKIQLTFDVRR